MTNGNLRLTTSARAFAFARAAADKPVVKKPDATTRPDASGFSLVELLVALTVCALLSGAIAAVVPPARAAFEATPHLLDFQQRRRTASDLLAGAIRSASTLVATDDDGAAGEAVPAVMLLDPAADGLRFRAMYVVTIDGQGRGVLRADQAGPSGPLPLRAADNCPVTGDVCGFAKGAVAAVVDMAGRFDVFTVASTSKGNHSLSPSRALAQAYPAGSMVIEASADTYWLQPQADGSSTLVRETAAGAVQPVVDQVLEVGFAGRRRPASSPGLVRFTVAELADGPWRLGGAHGQYDTDWRALRRVDITLRVGDRSAAPGGARYTVHLSVALRNPS